MDELFIFLGSLALLELGAECGFRVARAAKASSDEALRSQTTMIQGALLGLLALLLGFTFAMGSARYDLRKQLLVDETNAIDTAFLRAQLLPEPRRTELSRLLREYVELRLTIARNTDDRMLAEAAAESERLHVQLWAQMKGLEHDTASALTILMIQAMNEMIDVHTKRVSAFRNRVPPTVLLLLWFVALVTIAFMGYGSGIDRRRNLLAIGAVVLLVSSVVLLIIDLDHPRRGFISVSQQGMFDLHDQMLRWPK